MLHGGLGGEVRSAFGVRRFRNMMIDTIMTAPLVSPAIMYSVMSEEGVEAGGGWRSVPVTLTHPFIVGIVGWREHWIG